MSSYLPLNSNSPLIGRTHPLADLQSLCRFSPTLPKFSSINEHSKFQVCFAYSPINNSDNGREEARWLREEQRWLREEQRWLREESRWNAERESLLHQIHALKLRIEELERHNSVQGASIAETVANISALLQVLKEGDLGKKVNRIAESGLTTVPMVVEAGEGNTEMEEEVVVKEVVRISEGRKRNSLRKGSEGDEVQALQEALQKLGFFSGEEDMEYSSFSSGTERAVKTWQATLGLPEDGIMTADLLERLYMEQQVGTSGSLVKPDPKKDDVTTLQEKSSNGSALNSITEISEIQQTVVKEGGFEEVNVSQHRVFLLGENRWEEPSRLGGSNKQVNGSRTVDVKTCLSCRGEGRLLCTECDGTGEPNIEPQFLEWVGEGAKCPYCEGLGYTICDVCEGKTVV